ncbi:hypothetical protein LINPERHAP1_LOCUS31809 [Linum perenne]
MWPTPSSLFALLTRRTTTMHRSEVLGNSLISISRWPDGLLL